MLTANTSLTSHAIFPKRPQLLCEFPRSHKPYDTKKTNEALSAIVDLNQMVMNAKEISQNFSRMQDLMLRSVTLSGEESDRLMRYQTTWERRLSSAMGELLALQAKNGN